MEILPVGGGIGSRTLASCLHRASIRSRIFDAVREYKPLGVERRPATTRIAGADRQAPPAIIIARLEITGGKPFERLDTLIDARECRATTERYQAITGGDIRATSSAA